MSKQRQKLFGFKNKIYSLWHLNFIINNFKDDIWKMSACMRPLFTCPYLVIMMEKLSIDVTYNITGNNLREILF